MTTLEARELLEAGTVVVDLPITPADWQMDPRTGWPYPGLIARQGDSDELAEARHRAAARIRALRREIAVLREIFRRPAPRPGRADLAGPLGAESRDEGAPTEASDPASPRPAPAAVPSGGGRAPSPS